MFLYEKKLLELESEFDEVREKISVLEGQLYVTVEEAKKIDKVSVKLKMDLLTGEIRLLKERMSFYLKMKESYDLARFKEEFLAELDKEDKELCRKIIRRLKNRWLKEKKREFKSNGKV
ncbi:MAG: hypothetical protein ABIC40_02545 [bacterium]